MQMLVDVRGRSLISMDARDQLTVMNAPTPQSCLSIQSFLRVFTYDMHATCMLAAVAPSMQPLLLSTGGISAMKVGFNL